jgi:type II secretory ATPase GspE/PulE/Tfp pilus assembly ATPase PilB-like protein
VVGELILISDAVAQSIIEMNSSIDIEKIAITEGMKTLHYDAIKWVAEGATSLEEVKRAGV